ncbi:nucleotide pyrophosphohydrolase [Candidatus Pacearchaeota archaeon]|nr:nucleotide pyrophosphohydrolase [Candidatus Pacearchaeota archaeon]
MNIQRIIDDLIKFRDDRDWLKFHTGPELARSLTIEATELNRLFQWGSDPEYGTQEYENLREEIADVMIYALYLADKYNVPVEEAILEKIEKNAIKYPVAP